MISKIVSEGGVVTASAAIPTNSCSDLLIDHISIPLLDLYEEAGEAYMRLSEIDSFSLYLQRDVIRGQSALRLRYEVGHDIASQ